MYDIYIYIHIIGPTYIPCLRNCLQRRAALQDPNEDLGLGFPYDTFLGESRPQRPQEASQQGGSWDGGDGGG